MHKQLAYLVILVGAATSLLSASKPVIDQANQLTPQEKKEGWTLLFDGKTTHGWHLYNRGKVASVWAVNNGELVCQPANYKAEQGDLITDESFKNYELKFEWKIAKEGNSGVFINVLERKDIPTAWASGPEYQLLDNAHPDYATSPKKRAGTLFNFYPPLHSVDPRPAGAWNESLIKQVNGKIDFYLNGVLTAQEDLGAAHWKDMVAASNFKAFPEFGKYTQGRIALQDWSKGIWFRNIKIKPL